MKKIVLFPFHHDIELLLKDREHLIDTEIMGTCLQLCTTGCKDCGEVCGGSLVNGAAIISTPGAGGTPDYNLLATGNILA